jgi:hypothetical protein
MEGKADLSSEAFAKELSQGFDPTSVASSKEKLNKVFIPKSNTRA